MKNIYTLFLFQLKNHKKYILIWAVIMGAVMAMYMAFFPTMQEMAQVKFEMMPKEFLQLVGMENFSDMENYNQYFYMIFNILIIITSIFSSTFGANLILKEEKNKTIEFLYSLQINRKEIYISKLILAFSATVTVILLIFLSGAVCGYSVGGETFIISDMFVVIKITSFTAVFFMGLGLALSAVSSRYISSSLVCGIVALSYLLGYLGKLLEDKGGWLKYLSPFELFSPSNAVSLSNETLAGILIYTVILAVFIFAGGYVYSKRDFSL